jgi:hypothetical protein
MVNMSTDGHYIDNKVFYEEIVKWKQEWNTAKENQTKLPPVTDYIGRCFLAIAERLSYRPNFINYPYRDEMVGDGIENCLMYAANFDPSKSKNPFSYFTQIIYYAFIRRIQKEKKQNYIKFKSIEVAQLNGKIPNWLKNVCYDENKMQEFFRTLSLSDTDLKNFEVPPVKKEMKPTAATEEPKPTKKKKKT